MRPSLTPAAHTYAHAHVATAPDPGAATLDPAEADAWAPIVTRGGDTDPWASHDRERREVDGEPKTRRAKESARRAEAQSSLPSRPMSRAESGWAG
jgi:hypothetical protein